MSSRATGQYPTTTQTATYTFSKIASHTASRISSKVKAVSASPAPVAVTLSLTLPWCGTTLLKAGSRLYSSFIGDFAAVLDVPAASVMVESAVCYSLSSSITTLKVEVGTSMIVSIIFTNVSTITAAANALLYDVASPETVSANLAASLPSWYSPSPQAVSIGLDENQAVVAQVTSLLVGVAIGGALGCSLNGTLNKFMKNNSGSPLANFASAFNILASQNGFGGAPAFSCRVGTLSTSYTVVANLDAVGSASAHILSNLSITGIVVGALILAVLFAATLKLIVGIFRSRVEQPGPVSYGVAVVSDDEVSFSVANPIASVAVAAIADVWGSPSRRGRGSTGSATPAFASFAATRGSTPHLGTSSFGSSFDAVAEEDDARFTFSSTIPLSSSVDPSLPGDASRGSFASIRTIPIFSMGPTDASGSFASIKPKLLSVGFTSPGTGDAQGFFTSTIPMFSRDSSAAATGIGAVSIFESDPSWQRTGGANRFIESYRSISSCVGGSESVPLGLVIGRRPVCHPLPWLCQY